MPTDCTPVRPGSERARQAARLAAAETIIRSRDHALPRKRWRESAVLPQSSRSPLPWWERTDPYWSTRVFSARRNWSAGPGAEQYGGAIIGDLVPDGQSEHYSPGRRRMQRADKTSEAALLRNAQHKQIVAMLRGAGLASDEQVTALIGAESANKCRRIANQLIQAEVVEEAWHHAPGIAWPRVRCWQIKWGAGYRLWARQMLDSGEGPDVFGCMRPSLSARSDRHRARAARHQCLSVEAALRAMEVDSTWAGWMPESACRPEWFLPPGHPSRADDHAVIADGCLIRASDGARLFLEIEANPSPDRLAAKVKTWSTMLSAAPFGAALLFIAAPQPSSMGGASQTIRQAIAEHAAPGARPWIMLGAWSDYSPDYGLLGADIKTLRAARLANRTGSSWEECHAAEIEVQGAEAGIVDRLRGLSFTPPWAPGPPDVR